MGVGRHNWGDATKRLSKFRKHRVCGGICLYSLGREEQVKTIHT